MCTLSANTVFLRARVNTSAFYTTTTTMTPQNEYRLYCQQHQKQIPLFHQPWWLDIACGKTEWIGLVSTTHFQGKPAIMPIPIMNKWGIKHINKPAFTTYLGPWWAGFEALPYTDQEVITNIFIQEIYPRIPFVVRLKQTTRPEFQDIINNAISATILNTRRTYLIKDLQNKEAVYKGFRRDVKRNIKKAAQEVSIRSSENIGLHYQLIEAVYKRQNIKTPFSFKLLSALYQAAYQRDMVSLHIAFNTKEEAIGGLLCFQDYKSIYLLASGLNEEGRQKSVFPKLVWHCIQEAPAHINVFDFCGSMIERIAKRNTAYGATPHPFLELVRWW